MRSFEELLVMVETMHTGHPGHVCPGQVLGLRMAIRGCCDLDIEDPSLDRGLIVFVEIDRCAADAIAAVTGCRLGKRTLKHMDYGKMAATFVNIKTGKAVRVVAREDARQRAKEYFPQIEDKYAAQLEAYKVMPNEELFDVMEVSVKIKPEDMPGRPLRRVKCDMCGEYIQDLREVYKDRKVLCKPCADSGYYSLISN